MTRHRTLAVFAALAVGAAISADPVCETDAIFDVSGIPILPFGGEVLGAGTLEGTIVDGHVDVTFTATGSFDAADLGVSFGLPVNGGAGVGFTGAQLGWSGQGTFTASFPTSSLNGELLVPDGGVFYTWFVFLTNGNPGNGPISGNFDELRFTVSFGECPLGDLDGDFAVSVSDLLMLLAAWGDPGCADKLPCDADLDGDGVVGTADLLIMLGVWGNQWCPGCS